MTRAECFQLGYVQKVFGLHGGLYVALDVDDPADYEQVESVFAETPQGLVPFFVQHWEVRGPRANVRFEGIDSRDEAAALVGCGLFLPLGALPPAPEGSFYFHELVGFAVKDEAHGPLGAVESIYESPQQTLLGVRYEGLEVLVPTHPDVLLGVDRAARSVRTRLPEGLLDVYLNPGADAD